MTARFLRRFAGVAVVLATTGCATMATPTSRSDYASIFTDVLRKSFAETKVDNLCLPQIYGFAGKPNESIDLALEPGGSNVLPDRIAQLKALEGVGLVSTTESDKTLAGKTQRVTTYRRTPKGDAAFVGSAFCYARVELDRVVKWKGPIALGDYRAAFVYFTVRSSHVADWASAPAVSAAFPTVKAFLTEPIKQRQVAIDLSSEGWDIAEYSKLLQLQ